MSATQLDSILIPTDLSDLAGTALEYGAFFSRRLGSHLTLFFADEMFVPQMPLGYYIEHAGLSRQQQLEAMDAQARRYAPGIAVDKLVIADRPSKAILAAAEDIRADLIIMGTHGRQGFERVMLGSITERVLRHSTRPVLTAAASRFPATKNAAIRTILCPINFQPVSRLSADYAASLAALLSAELVLLYVDEGPHAAPPAAGRELEAWLAGTARERVRYRQVVTHGDAPDRVLSIADEVDADMIVLGVQHKAFRDATVIGTTSERIIRFAPRPVLTVPLHPQNKEVSCAPQLSSSASRS